MEVRDRFDQACRYGAKLDPVGLLCWLLGETPDELRFRTWLDARTVAFPGTPTRTCDTVAWLADEDPAVEWAVPVEFLLEPDEKMFGRMLVYLGLLWLEKRPTDQRGERFRVGAVVVNLTGRGNSSRDMVLRRTGLRTGLWVVERDLTAYSAAEVLDGIAAGRVPRCVLMWVALMTGGGEEGTIRRWCEVAAAEPDARRRAEYGGLVQVLAEAAGCQEAWRQALRGWDVRESQVVNEWIAEGEATALLRVLRARFGAVPDELASQVRQTADLPQLERWLDLASTAASLDAFRQGLHPKAGAKRTGGRKRGGKPSGGGT
jgi:hypothetical protein